MPGIGISQCPPFNNMPGVPGILYDGNTVAWFRDKDPRTVIKDGANRVSAWLNSMNLTIGPELVNQAAWYTAAYWNGGFAANWSQVGVTLSSAGNSGNAQRNNIFTLSRTYKIEITVTRVAGTLNITNGIDNYKAILATGSYIFYVNVQGAQHLLLSSVLFNGTVTALSVKEVSGPSLIQLTGANQPLWSANGILFDGTSDYLKTQSFVFTQPEMIYLVLKQITWTLQDVIIDGNTDNTGKLDQSLLANDLRIYAGVYSAVNNNLPLNNYAILRILFNGATSTFQINKTASLNGNYGATNMSGFTLGKFGTLGLGYSNIEVKEIILRRTADSQAVQDTIYNYLKRANGV